MACRQQRHLGWAAASCPSSSSPLPCAPRDPHSLWRNEDTPRHPLYTLFCPPTPNPSPSATTPIPASVKAGGGLQSHHGVAPCQKLPLPGALLGIPRASPTLSMHQPCWGGAQWRSRNRAMPACLGAQAHGHCCIFRCCFWSIKHWICWVVARGRGQGMGAVGSTPSPAHMAQAPPLHKHTCPTSVTACVYLTSTGIQCPHGCCIQTRDASEAAICPMGCPRDMESVEEGQKESR